MEVLMISNRFKGFLLYYIIYSLLVIGSGVFFGVLVNEDLFEAEPPSLGKDFAYLVLFHNLRNFGIYLLAPIFSPIFQLMDLGGSAFQITVGFRILGTQGALNKLFPHAFLEIPNMLFYQGISQYVLYTLISTKSLSTTFNLVKKMVPAYLLSVLILIIAAIIEGYM
ncbi:hypothetical protein GGQ92_001153 [Gracilibacillus halotolerans]|uniref:Stage II sporulation protein M n=1 Tax=Gracilibacillus halotolerans TaxID=74386 RepID=A0A841RED0_9BACI|nr:hypothetical protein [Gracilibacillus halotolerans]MBB6512370.1 hypothetical protein [Gracilibacillus halotolerans]